MLVRKVWQRDRFTAKKVLLKGTAIAEKGDYNACTLKGGEVSSCMGGMGNGF